MPPSSFKTIHLLKSGVGGHRRGASVCRGCGRLIWWCRTVAGKNIPFDENPDVVSQTETTEEVSTEHVHWASCSKPDSFRKRA